MQINLRRFCLWRKVSLANRTQGAAADQHTFRDHEVGIACDSRLALQPGDHVPQEVSLPHGVSGGSKFGDPDLVHAILSGKVDALLDVLLEVIGTIGTAVPVDGHGGLLAVSAGLKERSHPVETLARVLAVRDGRADKLGSIGVRRHVLLERLSSILRRHHGLLSVVGLVEAEKVLAARRERGVDRIVPAIETPRSPQHGNILDAGREGSAGLAVPVVCPRHTAASRRQNRDQADVVISSALLPRRIAPFVEVGMPLVWGSQSSRGRKKGNKEVLQ